MQVFRGFFDGLRFKVLEQGFRVLVLRCRVFGVNVKVVVQGFKI